MKKRLFTACAVVGLLLTTACRTAEKKTEPEPDNALKIGFVPSAEALPYLVAQEIGVYDSLRLQVRFVPMADTDERDTTFIRHATDGILLSLAESCRMQRKQVDIVPAFTVSSGFYLIASNDSLFTKLRQLKEKTVGLQLYAGEHRFIDKVLQRIQLSTEDVNLVNIGNERTRLQMLTGGQLDAAVLSDPQAVRALGDSCRLLASSADYAGDYAVVAFSDSILGQRQEEIKRLVIGYDKAVDYMNQQPESRWVRAATARMGLPVDSLCPGHAPFVHATAISAKAVSDVQQWLDAKELLPQKHNGLKTANIPIEGN